MEQIAWPHGLDCQTEQDYQELVMAYGVVTADRMWKACQEPGLTREQRTRRCLEIVQDIVKNGDPRLKSVGASELTRTVI